ncbi:hypothetical protein JVT61DRAFT_5771 [Boletus reticuloceps]|uniref:Alpha/beta-hydrolase n=1 Tax=Boletus reticuloceps TaxID=495285 RepID=A0A8I2Z224_9AGAM|nr:hypothetical protein JVT61DRAFT_5771 [Boletus reticuloceps]
MSSQQRYDFEKYNSSKPIHVYKPYLTLIPVHRQALLPILPQTLIDFTRGILAAPQSRTGAEQSFLSDGDFTPRHSRTRTRTGPSSQKPRWRDSPLPPLRFSGTSSLEDPPPTPTDASSLGDLFAHSFVAAPIAGVETLDALVDGMNGMAGASMEDLFSRRALRFALPGHHPLYQPPLPTPPPGVVLGKGKARRREKAVTSDDDDDDDDDIPTAKPPRSHPRYRHNPASSFSRKQSTSTITLDYTLSDNITPPVSDFNNDTPPNTVQPTERPRTVIPSISEIIRNHTPHTLERTRPPSVHASGYGHVNGSLLAGPEEEESEPEPLTPDEEAELSFSISPTSTSQAIAEYLRSARLTTLLKLTRYPHASLGHPLTVSLADMGDPNGFPLVVFLGLGCVRHIMGLYDEMADCLGLRLIAIDRWGLGRTEVPQSKSARGIMEWASVVEEVLDQLQIYECSVMAHSAGAPYALSFANRVPERIRGDLCLLAPWIGGGESGGYKWLKYVPYGILKTAQAAEWKIQAWMLGKPPTITYRGIGYTAPPSPSKPYYFQSDTAADSDSLSQSEQLSKSSVYPSQSDARRRMSVASSLFSDYDDLRDFDGRFGSQSTLGVRSTNQQTRRKTSRGILGRLKPSKSTSESQPPSPTAETAHQSSMGKKLKTLRSMGSLKGKAGANGSKDKTNLPSPQLPRPISVDIGLGLGDFDWSNKPASPLSRTLTPSPKNIPPPGKQLSFTQSVDTNVGKPVVKSPIPRQAGRRSISFSASSAVTPRSSPPSIPSSPRNSVLSSPYSSVITTASGSYQAALGNALIAASHAEASKGTHSDLLQILNHDNRPWGFSYTDYPHRVRVWYGDRDEKIAENAVRWMERTMGEDRCDVKVVKGADHALMYKSSVVVEVLECVREFW